MQERKALWTKHNGWKKRRCAVRHGKRWNEIIQKRVSNAKISIARYWNITSAQIFWAAYERDYVIVRGSTA
jgi:hypothetical protein